MENDFKNLILFVACALVLMAVYQFFVLGPEAKRRQVEAKARAAAEEQAPKTPSAPPASLTISRGQALAQSQRVPIDTPSLKGSISLTGARIDDLLLKKYRETLAPSSPLVELFRPEGAASAYFAHFGWTGTNLQGLPDDETPWMLVSGTQLSPGHPIVLSYQSPQGLKFTRTISVDRDYMFTVKDTVANLGATAEAIWPFATVQRHGLPADIFKAINVHQGAVGWLNDQLRPEAYRAWKKKGEIDYASRGGWLGITDKYWLAALVPEQGEQIRASYRVSPDQGVDIYDTSFLGQSRNLAPGQQTTETTRLFAGAKTAPLLADYSKTLGIPQFDRAVDWGRLWFLTRPAFATLEFFYHHVGNFGVAILLLTVCVRVLLFWPAQKSYELMTRMKKFQPEVEKIRQKYKEDPSKLQQETMALYQRERINPFMGCLPVLATFPVFLALFKVLSVTIEMRQAPFFGWVKDLSAPDPTTLWNLFGLIPWDPATAPMIGGLLGGTLHVGVWAIAYGFTMWLTQSMTPTAGMDPTQQKMMQFMPWIFMFVLARFTVGLLIYYTWSNMLSLVQQYVIMHRFKVDNPIDAFVERLRNQIKPPDK